LAAALFIRLRLRMEKAAANNRDPNEGAEYRRNHEEA
jgi:hypothetical protein